MKPRTLTLRQETLADLSTDELGSVAGAALPATDTKIPTRCHCTGMYPSLNMPCTIEIKIETSNPC